MTAPPQWRVEIAFGTVANPDAWRLGVSAFPVTLGDESIYAWTDVTADCQAVDIERGKHREIDVFGVGRCSIRLQNIQRTYDPLNLSGPYVSGGVTQIIPGKPIRVFATHPVSGIEYPMFRGTIRDWQYNYSPEFASTVTIQCTDQMQELADTGISLTTTPGTTGSALTEVLTSAGIGIFEIDTGESAIQAMTFSGTARAAATVLEQTEQGYLFVGSLGGITFRNRHTFLTAASSLVLGASDVIFESIVPTYESDTIKNKVRVTRQGGTLQEATNDSSIAAYGQRLLTYTGLAHATDGEALTLAESLVNRFGIPLFRVAEVVLAGQRDDDVMTAALGIELLDAVTVQFVPPGGSSAETRDCFVIGQHHQWQPPQPMKTTLYLMPADIVGVGWRLGVGELGDSTGPTATVLSY